MATTRRVLPARGHRTPGRPATSRWAAAAATLAITVWLGGPTTSAAPAGPGNETVGTEALGPVGGAMLASKGLVVGAGVPAPPLTDAASYVVADVVTGEVLAAKAAHAPQLPASTLKILTALTLLPALDKDEVVVGTPEAAAVEGSKAGIDPGLTYSIDLVFKAMLLQSGNDAAVTLSLAAGGVDETVEAMNVVADSLQALDTLVVNPSGLDAPGQVTSAYDLALITRAALARDDFRTYLTTPTAQMPDRNGGTYQIQNENRFVADYEGAIGVKNGYTDRARHTFVGAAERGGRTLVVTVLRTEGRAEPVVAALMDWGFANADSAEPVGRLVDPDDPLPAGEALERQPTDTPAPAGEPGRDGAEGAASVAATESSSEPSGTGGWLRTAGLIALALAAAAVALRARVLWRQRSRV